MDRGTAKLADNTVVAGGVCVGVGLGEGGSRVCGDFGEGNRNNK